jgi:hypothetical protein
VLVVEGRIDNVNTLWHCQNQFGLSTDGRSFPCQVGVISLVVLFVASLVAMIRGEQEFPFNLQYFMAGTITLY